MDSTAAPANTVAPSLGKRLVGGAVGIGTVSMLVFATVAFAERPMYRALGVMGAYLVWAVIFMVGGGLALSSLLRREISRPAFVGMYALGFLLYSIAYVAAYFPLKNQLGEGLGILVGSIALAVCLAAFFENWPAAPRAAVVLAVANLAGYFLGRVFWTNVAPPTGMLLWGLAYGVALGIGLGYCLHLLQTAPPRVQLQ